MAADLPNLKIDANGVAAPRLPYIPNQRVFTPEVITPRVVTPQVETPQEFTPQLAQLPSPLRDVANALAKGSDETNDIAKLYAKQAGFKAVSRDPDTGELIVTKAPIVGDAALAYQSAVKYTALAFAENEAKQVDLQLSKQFQHDPDGYMQAANAFREKHVAQYEKAIGADVGAELNKSVLNNITSNYRWLVLDQQRNIKEQFNQGTQAKLGSLETDIISLLQSGDKGSPELQQKLDEYTKTVKARVQNPVLGESPDVAAVRMKNLDLKVGAARYVSGINGILQNPDGGVQAAIEANESRLREKGGDATQRALDYAEGQKAIKDHIQNIERNINLAKKGQQIADDQEEEKIIVDSASPNPQITENDIKTNPRMSSAARMRMLAWQKRDGMPEPLAQVSQATAIDLFRKMNLPEGDPGRMNDLTPAKDAYIAGRMRRQDYDWIEKQFKEASTPQGQRLNDVRRDFNKAVEPSIDKSNPLDGKIDHAGKLENYRFQRFVDQKVEEQRAAGRSPYDLFDPAKPEYLGKPEVLKPFQTTISQSIKNMSDRLRTGPAARPQRNPGESPEDYLNRTGGGR